MLNFGRLKGEKTGFSVLTFLRKIITYSPERFSIAHHLFCLFVLFNGNLEGSKGLTKTKCV